MRRKCQPEPQHEDDHRGVTQISLAMVVTGKMEKQVGVGFNKTLYIRPEIFYFSFSLWKIIEGFQMREMMIKAELQENSCSSRAKEVLEGEAES